MTALDPPGGEVPTPAVGGLALSPERQRILAPLLAELIDELAKMAALETPDAEPATAPAGRWDDAPEELESDGRR